MRQLLSRKRPWVAAVLGAFVTGLGHLYLRRWKRAVGWLVVLFGASAYLVDPAALDAVANGTTVDPMEVAPLLVVGICSTADAYFLAKAESRVARPTVDEDGRLSQCPHCGRELDPELEFCHWCTADVGGSEADPADERDDRETF